MSLFDEFTKAAKEAAFDLNLDANKIEFNQDESPNIGLTYIASVYDGDKTFNFHLTTDTEEDDPTKGEMEALFSIYFAEGCAPYCLMENIGYFKKHSNFLSRWVAWAVFNFRKKHEPTNLHSLFHDAFLRVYGIPKYCNPAIDEAKILFNGILNLQTEKVLIYKFRHISKKDYLYRWISYAVFVRATSFSFWAIFPNNCGLDSGAASRTYKKFENLINDIKSKLKVEVMRFDVEYDEFANYLFRKQRCFSSCHQNNVLPPFHSFFSVSEKLVSEDAQEKLLELLEKRQYPQALRDLRALVQEAQENVAKIKKLDYSKLKRPNVCNLASFLIKENILDGHLSSWFESFSSIANMASHGDYPTEVDFKKDESRILLSFYLGMQLLIELDKVIKPQPTMISNSSDFSDFLKRIKRSKP